MTEPLEAEQQPIVPSPADAPTGPPRAQIEAARGERWQDEALAYYRGLDTALGLPEHPPAGDPPPGFCWGTEPEQYEIPDLQPVFDPFCPRRVVGWVPPEAVTGPSLRDVFPSRPADRGGITYHVTENLGERLAVSPRRGRFARLRTWWRAHWWPARIRDLEAALTAERAHGWDDW